MFARICVKFFHLLNVNFIHIYLLLANSLIKKRATKLLLTTKLTFGLSCLAVTVCWLIIGGPKKGNHYYHIYHRNMYIISTLQVDEMNLRTQDDMHLAPRKDVAPHALIGTYLYTLLFS